MEEPLEKDFLIGCAAIVLLKLVAVVAWRFTKVRRGSKAQALLGEPGELDWVPAAATGVFAAPWAMFVGALLLSDRSSSFAVHGSAIVFAVAAPVLFALCWRGTSASVRAFSSALAVSAVATVAFATWSLAARVTTVLDRAEALANGDPYCIQIATADHRFRPAVTTLDLSPMMMRARCRDGWCFQNHAILAIDSQGQRKLLHWSYRKGEFATNVLNATTKPPAVVCEPARGFVRKLPVLDTGK